MRTATRKPDGVTGLHGRTYVDGVIQLFFVADKLVVPAFRAGSIYVVTTLQHMLAQVVETCFAFYALRGAAIYFVIEIIVSHHLAVGRLHLHGHTKAVN